MRFLALLLAVVLLAPTFGARVDASPQRDEGLTRMLRQPDIHGDKIAFVYGGDIWIVDSTGGVARRLTSHPGQEQFPKFSPDGRWIAFTGEYSGTLQVFVISVDGGQPRQLTFYNDAGPVPPRGGVDNQIMDWTPDGKSIMFGAHRVGMSDRIGRPYVVPVEGGLETPLAITEAGNSVYSPDGQKIAYTPYSREFRTWKRYRGGRQPDVWIYDLATNTAEQITANAGNNMFPCWTGDAVYYASDRDRMMNLFAYDVKTKKTRKVTNHNDYDVLWASSGPGAVVYECGGYIYRYDTAKDREDRVPIRVLGDFPATYPYFKNVKDNIEAADLSPSGARALFAARGDLYAVPAKEGEIRNLTASEGVRERSPAWSPDGKWISYWSDRTGEYELYIRAQDGSGDERRLTTGEATWQYDPVWSPDSKMLAWSDKNQKLRYVSIDTGKVTDVDHSTRGDITTYTWSPDSKWLAYSKNAENNFSVIWLHSVAEGKNTQLTSGLTNDDSPTFDPKGRYIYFVSTRDFNLTFSNWEFNYIYTNPVRVYVGILAADGPALFLPESDEEKPKDDKPAMAAADKPKEEPKPAAGAASATPTVKIDFAGFEDRVRAIPGPSNTYRSLRGTNDGVLYLTGQGPGTRLELYNLEAKDKQTILEGVNGYVLSADGKQVLYARGNDFGIAPLRPGQKAGDNLLALDRMEKRIDPRAEWKQMYVDAWRTMRDWFYDPGMHSMDWRAVRAKYEVLLPYVATRQDLDYIFGELAGELGTGHVYVQPGDAKGVDRVDTGLLGAEIAAHPSGYVQITKIYPGENWQNDFRSPLTEPGVKVKEGEFILAVDGRSTREVKNFYELMQNKGEGFVTLLVNDKPDPAGAREQRVRPITKETNLRYLAWVAERRAMVEKASGGRIGYIHLPNTAIEGNRELFKNFYAQFNKEALILDDRYNGGGFIPDRMIELLDRPLLNYWVTRGAEPGPTPGVNNQGPKVMLTNPYAGSGGDALPYYFRKRGLGKVIGTTTWGGLIGLSGNPALVDGGTITVPTFRFLSTDGKWVVENEGVAPDILVVDRPDDLAKGKDPSLEKGIQVLLEELKANPPRKVTVPPPPKAN